MEDIKMIQEKNMKTEKHENSGFLIAPIINPKEIEVHLFERISTGEFNGELVITGCPTDSNGQPIWQDMNDLVSNPHNHGLLLAIDTICQIVKIVDAYLVVSGNKSMPKLRIRFAAKITDVFKSDSNLKNPVAWIHIGHGNLEHSIELLEDLEEWEEELLESIPGLSDGHDDGDYISAKWLRGAIKTMEGNILLMALPLCYGRQISEVLAESQSIHYIHAPISFGVPEMLEFYDCDENKILPAHTLNGWTNWMRWFETVLRSAIINHFGKMSEK